MVRDVLSFVCLLGMVFTQTILRTDKGVAFTREDCTTCQPVGVADLAVRSMLECAVSCQNDEQCVGFFYRKKTSHCAIRGGSCCDGWQKYLLLKESNTDHKELYIKTPENHFIQKFFELTRYGLSAEIGYVKLKIRTCDGIPHVGLSEIHPDIETPYYHLIFRHGHQFFQIRQRNKDELFGVTTTPLAVCEEFLSYWIRWSNTTLEVGRGHSLSEDSRFLMWTRDVNFYIRYISVASWSVEVEFIFLY